MFGQNNQQQPQDDTLIPEQAIDGALADVTQPDPVSAPASTDWQHPGQPLDAPAATDESKAVVPVDTIQPAADAVPTEVPSDLLEIKQHALSELTPLVDHLEQSPEEKFRTTMMLIQASDNQSLVHVAYEAALAIQDETVKAQALLDVINEINYFTQSLAQHSEA